jgi:acyl-CoA dehydrogenase
MDFTLPHELTCFLDELDGFIEAEIKPLEQQDDNIRFFDHRREYERTNWEQGSRCRLGSTLSGSSTPS